jgi:hypothetical protein
MVDRAALCRDTLGIQKVIHRTWYGCEERASHCMLREMNLVDVSEAYYRMISLRYRFASVLQKQRGY